MDNTGERADGRQDEAMRVNCDDAGPVGDECDATKKCDTVNVNVMFGHIKLTG